MNWFISETKRALCVGSRTRVISWTTIYSRHSRGFLASSVLRRILRASWLQLPHLVFIRCTKNRSTFTPISGSHLAINGGTAFLSCQRYHASTIACFFFASVPGRTCRSIQRCFKEIGRASCRERVHIGMVSLVAI